MSEGVRIAFEREIIFLRLRMILPSKTLAETIKHTLKYKRIIASVEEIGLVEPLVVARQKGGLYLLLDGHVRFDALRKNGIDEARCVVADDDETFTYNKRVNRLAAIQEHYMIARAIERGVSEEKLARALNLDVSVILKRRDALKGIGQEVVELLKDKSIGHEALGYLRKMKPIRQLEAVELMISANNFTTNYVVALLATSKPIDLNRPSRCSPAKGLSTEQMSRLQRELASVNQDYKQLEMSYGNDMLVLVVASGFLERLLSKPEIVRFLGSRHPEFLENFKTIVATTSLDQSATAA